MNLKDIGSKLKALREDRRLSMRDLASASNVSASFISKVESGKVSPTVMSLQKLLEGMNVDLYEFFIAQTDNDISDQVHFCKAAMAASEDEEHIWYYAFPKHPDIKVEFTYEEYAPQTMLVESESHRGDVFGYVISGELTLEVDGKGEFKVKSGDAFYLKAGQPHVASNKGKKVLKMVAGQVRQ